MEPCVLLSYWIFLRNINKLVNLAVWVYSFHWVNVFMLIFTPEDRWRHVYEGILNYVWGTWIIQLWTSGILEVVTWDFFCMIWIGVRIQTDELSLLVYFISLIKELTLMGGLWKFFLVTALWNNYTTANFQTCAAGSLAASGKTGAFT